MSLFINYTEHDATLRKSGTFWFGKYKDMLVAPILESEPSYIVWLSENCTDWLTIDPQLLQEANELYDAGNDNEIISKQVSDWWDW